MNNELLTCPWCGEKMRFDADSVHCWFNCDNCLAASPKALRAWDVAKSTKDNWADNEQHALRLTKEVEWHVHPPHWINVEDRLPEKGMVVLVRWHGEMAFARYTPHRLGWYNLDTRYDSPNAVSYWMPLPPMPKED